MVGDVVSPTTFGSNASCFFTSLILLLSLGPQPSYGFALHNPQRNTVSTMVRRRKNMSWLRMVRESDKFDPEDEIPPVADSSGPEVITPPLDGDDEYGDKDEDWIPDMQKARKVEEWNLARAEDIASLGGDATPTASDSISQEQQSSSSSSHAVEDPDSTSDVDDFYTPTSLQKSRREIYTDDEEELINQMGGNSMDNPSPKREPGFLGDSSLKEISRDFQVPVCYLADVLCTWGVPVPINVDDRLGDMVTGEMAFALAEAVHTLDVGEIYDSYSSFDLLGLCNEYSVELKDAFDFCIKENWNLPFGVKTHLRVDQEDKLLRALSDDLIY